MSIDRLINNLKGYAASQAGQLGAPRQGILTNYDPVNHVGRVTLQPEGTLTGWLQIETPGMGPGWGLQIGPPIGAQCKVTPGDNGLDSGTISGFVWSDADRPPGAPSGETWLLHSTGSMVKLTNDGHILLRDAAGSLVTLTNDGQMTLRDQSGTTAQFSNDGAIRITGNLYVSGDIYDHNRTDGGGSVDQLRQAYNAHGHEQGSDSHGDAEQLTNPTNMPVDTD